MDKTKSIEQINAIALQVTLADIEVADELNNIFTQLKTLAKEQDIGFVEEIADTSENICFNITSQSPKSRQEILAFTLDYITNAIASSNGVPGNTENFKQELEALCGIGEAQNQTAQKRIQENPALAAEFIQNTSSMLEEQEAVLLAMEKNGYEKEKIHGLFRTVHTLKSEANLLGLTKFGKAMHSIEDLLEKVRSSLITFTDSTTSLMLSSIDRFKAFLKVLETDISKAVEDNFDDTNKAVEAHIESALRIALGLDEPASPKPKEKKKKKSTAAKKANSFEPTIPELDLSEGASLIAEFATEAHEHLENSEEAILQLENTPDDDEAINRIFRAFHTIKGATGFLNLSDMKTLAHTAETMLDLVRSKTLKFNSEVADLTLESIDQMRTLLMLLEKQLSGEDISAEYINIGPQVEKLNNLINTKTAKDNKPIGEIMLEEGIITDAELDEALQRQREEEQDKKVGQILTEMNAASTKEVNRAVSIQSQKIESSIKVNLGKVDELVDLVGELVISQTQVMHSPIVQSPNSETLRKNVLEMERIMRQLQSTAMTMRLVPVKSTFQKMGRIIRDLSKKSGKAIDIVMQGEDTEIDKNMVELVSDPLIHMVRNAADHGIETPDKRIEKGKNPTGTIILAASQKGGNIVIEIRDDGAGLNKERILQKAIEKGIISKDEHLSDKRIWNLIFAPGFSTAEKVTDISGRGVGMDVVRKNIEQLRGKVDIESTKNQGSVFSIALPVTLAIIEGIILSVGPERYILPISSVVEFSAPDPANLSTVVGQGQVYKFHDEICPVIALDSLFETESKVKEIKDRTICIFDSDYGRFCLLVDEILSQQQVVIKNLGKRLGDIHGVSGCAILGDGRIGLILDTNGIVNFHKYKNSRQLQSAI